MRVRFSSPEINKKILREYRALGNLSVKGLTKRLRISEAKYYNFCKGALIPRSIVDRIFKDFSILREKYYQKIVEILPDNWGQIKGGKKTYKQNFKKRKTIGSFQYLETDKLKEICKKGGKATWKKNPEKMKAIITRISKQGAIALHHKIHDDPKFKKEYREKNLKILEKARKQFQNLMENDPEFRKKHIIRFQQNSKKKYIASNGIKVRSKIELEVIEILLKSEISFEYEKLTHLENRIFFPDFLIKNKVIVSVCCYMVKSHLKKYIENLRCLQKICDIIVITYNNRGKIGDWFISHIPNNIALIFTNRLNDGLISTINEML